MSASGAALNIPKRLRQSGADLNIPEDVVPVRVNEYEDMGLIQVKEAVETACRRASVLVQQEQKEGKDGQEAVGIVRGAAQTAVGYYAWAKELSPNVLRSAVDKVEDTVNKTVPTAVAKVSSLNNSIIDGIDSRLDRLQIRINEIYHMSPADYVNYAAVTATSVKSWSVELLHFNLIDYCREVVARTNARAKSLADPLQSKMALAVVELDKAKVLLQEQIAKASSGTAEQVEATKAELKAAAQRAQAAAASLAAISAEFVQARKAKLPAPASKSVDFILASPQVVKDVAEGLKAKAGANVDFAKATLDNANNLLVAVKEVTYAHVVTAATDLREEVVGVADAKGEAQAKAKAHAVEEAKA